MKVGQKVKTTNPIATGVIIKIDDSIVPYHVRLDSPARYDDTLWKELWYEAADVQLINQIINKLK